MFKLYNQDIPHGIWKMCLWNTNRRWGLQLTHIMLTAEPFSISYLGIKRLKRLDKEVKGATGGRWSASVATEEGELVKFSWTRVNLIGGTEPSLFHHTNLSSFIFDLQAYLNSKAKILPYLLAYVRQRDKGSTSGAPRDGYIAKPCPKKKSRELRMLPRETQEDGQRYHNPDVI